MILAKITFGPSRPQEAERLQDLAESYLAALLHARQLCGEEYFLAWTKGCLNAHVLLAGRGARQLRYHSSWGQRAESNWILRCAQNDKTLNQNSRSYASFVGEGLR